MCNCTLNVEPNLPNNPQGSFLLSFQSKIKNIQVNRDLTVQNSSEKGLQWIKDTIFGPDFPILSQEVISLVERGYQLGQPSDSNASSVIVGIYKNIIFFK